MDDDLERLTEPELRAEVKRLRAGIRAHRDSSGHELCWHHPQLWGLLPERIAPEIAVPPWPKFMRGCVHYRESLERELPNAKVADGEHHQDAKGAAARKEIDMLGEQDAIATIAVKDLAVARKFYEGTLGLLAVGAEGQEAIVFKSGNATVNVYRSQYAGTNKATALSWVVGERLDDVVQKLKAKGVTFEHYDMPEGKRQGDVHLFGTLKTAWFKDPDGNILSVMNR
jgi:catechol 2,3-dioxygenase-like lactoylglutathione lyase family enzyme